MKQVLDEQYDALSAQGLADAQIAEMLYMRERTLRTWKRERR